jgi:DNA polymerase (family 10)
MDRFAIAARLRETGAWLRFRGDPGYRARAYDRGADAVEATADLEELAHDRQLTSVAGIGDSLARQITELIETGRSSYLDRLRGGLPETLVELREVAGLSPEKIIRLHQTLGVRDRAELLEAARAGRVRSVKGFGEKTEAKLIEALSRERAPDHARMTVDDADALGREVAAYLRARDGVEEVVIAGELRRAEDTIGVVDLVARVRPDAIEHALDALAGFARVAGVEARESHSVCVRLAGGAHVRLTAATAAGFAEALLLATGPADHARTIAELVRGAGAPLDGAEEAALYARAGLPTIPPEQRHRTDVVEAALAGEGFDDLVTDADLRGVVHCHTTYSDGRNSVEEMAQAAEVLGLSYITITDHSTSAHYAGGLDADRLARQADEIAEVQSRVRIRILRGTESDITRDGALDYPDAVLERLDVIIASIHTRHQLDAAAMTERVIRAMRHPLFKIWGHALGRILLHREPYVCDVERILDAIAESGAAIELNGDPNRLDLPAALVPAARSRGIRFVISADAHSTRGLDALRWGVAAARRGGLRRAEVLNTLPADRFAAAVRPTGARGFSPR